MANKYFDNLKDTSRKNLRTNSIDIVKYLFKVSNAAACRISVNASSTKLLVLICFWTFICFIYKLKTSKTSGNPPPLKKQPLHGEWVSHVFLIYLWDNGYIKCIICIKCSVL